MMKQLLFSLALIALVARPLHALESFSEVKGIKDACRAGSVLDASHVPYEVVVFHSLTDQGAGCLYRLNGDEYLYSERGSAKVVPARVAEVPLEKVPRDAVLHIADGDRDIHNGCLVDAAAQFASYKHNPHIVWAGVIAAQVIRSGEFGAIGYQFSSIGHAITAYETDQHEIYIQEDGDEARRVDWLTDKAKRGDMSWYDSSAIIYADHHIQAVTTFKSQYGRPQ
jgi:hypothetical protein